MVQDAQWNLLKIKPLQNQIQESASLPKNKQKHETITEENVNQGFSKRKRNLDFFFFKFKHQVPFIRVKKPSLGWKRGGKKKDRKGR